MSVRPIVQFPDSRLRRSAQPITDWLAARPLLQDLWDSLQNTQGIGLAANQIGILQRAIVIDLGEQETPPLGMSWPLFLLNPSVRWESTQQRVFEEGCLSIPGHQAAVSRPEEVHVTYTDSQGHPQKLHATGLLAICVQHEIDHLNGILFLDRISRMKRDMIVRKLRKENRRENSNVSAFSSAG